jgi:hypothetical protein
MCDPITATTVALAVATTVSSGVAQVKAAKAQTKAIRDQKEVVAEETRQAASGELFDQMRASRREQARIRTAAGEAGLSLASSSIDALLNDSAMQGELQGARSIANMESRHAANAAEAGSMLSRIQKPTALGIGLNTATAAASAWSGSPHAAKIAKKG